MKPGDDRPSASDTGQAWSGQNDGNTSAQLVSALVQLVLELYRLSSLTTRVLESLDPLETKKYISRVGFIRQNVQQILEGCRLRIVPLEGLAFEEGMAVSVVNLDSFGGDDELVIDQVLEPLIMGEGEIVHPGTVSLKRKE